MKPGDRIEVTGIASIEGEVGYVKAIHEGHFGRRWFDIELNHEDGERRVRESDVAPCPRVVDEINAASLSFTCRLGDGLAEADRALTPAGRRYWEGRG